MPEKFNPKIKYYLSVLAAVLAPLIFAMVIIYPLFFKIIDFSGQFMGAKDELKTLDLKRGFIKDLEKELEEKQADLPKIENSFLDKNKIVEFIKIIEKFALENNVDAEIKNISEINKLGALPFISVQISTLSSYPNFMKFIRMLENSTVYSAIDSLQLRLVASKDIFAATSNKNINVNLIVKVYVKN